MAKTPETPNFGELLRPALGRLPDSLVPAFLAGLERSAAERYRSWAEACDDPEQARDLLACAASEDEIADRAEKLFPVSAEERRLIEELLPEARRIYLGVFDPHPVADQWRMQADAELQGAAAWRGIASSHPDPAVREGLESCAELEEESSARLRKLLEG